MINLTPLFWFIILCDSFIIVHCWTNFRQWINMWIFANINFREWARDNKFFLNQERRTYSGQIYFFHISNILHLKFNTFYFSSSWSILTLIWLGFLGVCVEVGRGGGKITPCLKLVRIMLEPSNLARKYTHICSFRKYTF